LISIVMRDGEICGPGRNSYARTYNLPAGNLLVKYTPLQASGCIVDLEEISIQLGRDVLFSFKGWGDSLYNGALLEGLRAKSVEEKRHCEVIVDAALKSF